MAVVGASVGPTDSVSIEIADGVAWISISNAGKRNAFTWRMYDQLSLIADDLSTRDDVRAVVIRGTAEDGFASGTDIRQFADFESGGDGVQYEERVAVVLGKLLAIRVPVVALVQGAAVGAGLAVVLCCDVVIAERGAVFGAPIARTIGNCLPATVVARLRSRVGASRAMAMLLTSTLVPAEELVSSGLVYHLAESGELDVILAKTLGRITTSAPLTLRSLKEIGRRLDAASTPPNVDDLLSLCYGSEDFHEGVRAFIDRRHPDWKGR